MSDQGGEFENKLVKQLNALCGVKKIRTTPYHPQTNGTCERMNQTLLKMLRTLPENLKSRWPESVSKMVHAYNCTKHSTTGYSPCYLLFGREPSLPIDVIIGIETDTKGRKSYQKYVADWKRQMKEAYKIVMKNSESRKKVDQKRWNAKRLLSPLEVGDHVLVQNKETGGPGKLRSFWEQKIYEVTALKGAEGVVYEVKEVNNRRSKPRIVHIC